ncbi:armadillo-type protein [Papiliotrema laurentii]|uniref:Armadillo-type protein n=1 Tax=Papiliotrema laurentii TaxID=5418 RepID=A0AAD9FRY1_PAPLA|nr:armadillo-type protein [Papiliotrema laurentii]
MGQFSVPASTKLSSGSFTPPSTRESTSAPSDRNSTLYPPQRSSLLEDYRIHKLGRRWELEDITGYLVEFSTDQHGSRFVQQKIEAAGPEEKQKIYDELMPYAYELMQDVFGNYVVQKMFELGDPEQKTALADKMRGNVLPLSMQMYGCRVVQKALEHVTTEQRAEIVAELEPHFVECLRSSNANHVIQRLITLDPPQSLSSAFLGHFQELATNPFGCRVIQKMIEQLGDDMKRQILDEMHPISAMLMQDQFGNYVIQSVITVGSEEDRQKVVDRLKGQMLNMSRHKFASNVCERAMQHARPEDRRSLIDELINMQPDGSTHIPMLLRDAFGNFPLQVSWLRSTLANNSDRIAMRR